MKLEQIRTFLAVLDHGSFTRTATALGVSQSTVSFQIASLEEHLGMKVLDRGRGEARPTPAGRVILRFAPRILGLVSEAEAEARLERDTVKGRVVLQASTIPSEYLLPRQLAVFRRLHPDVSVTVVVSDSQRAVTALLEERCDLCVVGSMPQARTIQASRVARDEVVLVGPPDAEDAVSALDDLPLVVRERGSGTRSAVAHLIPASPLGIEVGSSEAARRCVLEGLGYSLISRLAVAEDLAAGRMKVVSLPGVPVERSFFVARRAQTTPTAAARVLWKVLSADA
jgi:DNA-binding transcriptional LysR family regulator